MAIHSVFLKYFDEVCKCGSIRKAAKNLFVASSAVNRQILNKEEELGVKLFERSTKGIKLTVAGEIFSQHVVRTLVDYERTISEINASTNNRSHGITIVGQESIVSRFLSLPLAIFHTQHPGITTSFIAASGRKLNKLLISGQADIALVFDPEPSRDITVIETIELPVGAAISVSHPLAGHKSLSLKECADYPLILPDESWPLRDILNAELKNIVMDPNIMVTTSNSIEFLRSMLGKKLNIGFQTIIGLEEAVREGLLLFVPLENENPIKQKFSICINRNAKKNDVIESVLDLLKSRALKYSK